MPRSSRPSPDTVSTHATHEDMTMTTTTKRVYLETFTIGQHFGTGCVIRAVGSRRKLAVTDETRPYGFDHAVRLDGEQLALERGWTVVEVRS